MGYVSTNGAALSLVSSGTSGVFSAIAFSQTSVAGNKGLILYENFPNSFKFRTNGSATDRFVITSGGLVGIGVTPSSFQLLLSTDNAGRLASSTWSTSSDERLREDIVDADLHVCFDNVKNLRLKYYKWKEDMFGLIRDKHNRVDCSRCLKSAT